MDPFAEVRRKGRGQDEQFKRLSAILSAVEETIFERKASREATSNEYFAVLVTALDAADDAQTLGDLLHLLELCASRVAPVMLRQRFEAIARGIQDGMEVLVQDEENGNGAHTAALRRSLILVGVILRAQEASAAAWQSPLLMQLLHLLTTYFDDKRPKLRKAAHLAVTQLLQHHHALAAKAGASQSSTALARHVANFAAAACATAAAACNDAQGGLGKREATAVLHLCGFLQMALAFLPGAALPKIIDALFSVVGGGSTVATAAYGALAVAVAHPQCELDAERLAEMAERLCSSPPAYAYGAAARSSHARLLGAAVTRLPEASPLVDTSVDLLITFLEADDGMLQQSASAALANIVRAALAPRLAASAPRAEAFVGKLAGLLQLRWQHAWPSALPLLGHCFFAAKEALAAGAADAALAPLAALLREVGGLYDQLLELPEAAEPAARRAVRGVVADALEALGPEWLLGALPLTAEGDRDGGVSERRAWLVPLLRAGVRGSPGAGFAFFKECLLPLAAACDKTFKDGRKGGATRATARLRCVAVWGLLPQLAGGCDDLSVALAPLAPTLAGAMGDESYPELLAIVCASIKAAVARARDRAGAPRLDDMETGGDGDGDGDSDGDGEARADDDEAEVGDDADMAALQRARVAAVGGNEPWRRHADVQALSALAHKFLPAMFSLLEASCAAATAADDPGQKPSSGEAARRAALRAAIAAYASVAPGPLVARLLKRLSQRLLEGATAASQGKSHATAAVVSASCAFAALAAELAPLAAREEALLLLRVLSPLLRLDGAPALQKRAYRLLLALLGSQRPILAEGRRLEGLLGLLSGGALMNCAPASRALRLRCLSRLVGCLDCVGREDHRALLPSLLGETVLCTKDSNGGARNAAYAFLGALARASGDVPAFVAAAAGGLSATTPQMVSASALALARLLFDYGRSPDATTDALARDAEEAAAVRGVAPVLLDAALELLRGNSGGSREVAKAALALVRVCVGAMAPEDLERKLHRTVEALMVWTAEKDRRSHLRTIIKRILAKLCRRFGYRRVAEMVPEGDQPLLSYMEKMARREQAKKEKRREARRERLEGRGGGDADGDEEDDELQWFDSDDEDEDGAQGKAGAGGGRMLRSDAELMGGALGELKSAVAREMDDGDGDDDDGAALEFDGEGRMVVPDDDDDDGAPDDDSAPSGFVDPRAGVVSYRDRKKRRRQDDDDEADGAEEPRATSRRQKDRARDRRSDAAGRHSGDRYKSKKGGGDALRKGQKFEPYAYIPLDPKSLQGKKNRKAGHAVKEFSGVVSGRKHRGYAKRRRR